jgi:hypothetical protein
MKRRKEGKGKREKEKRVKIGNLKKKKNKEQSDERHTPGDVTNDKNIPGSRISKRDLSLYSSSHNRNRVIQLQQNV